MVVDLYKLIGKRDVNLTILCDSYSEFLIKNENDMIRMFGSYKGVDGLHLFFKDVVDNLVASIIVRFGWDVRGANQLPNEDGEVGGEWREM